jgi:hypothetical protein
MQPSEAALLIAGGTVAGVINTMAGGGSLLTVPLLLFLGLPGGVANATNRVGTTLQSVVASWRFRAEGVSMLREASRIAPPLALGAALGAWWISRISDALFEQLFAWLMLLLALPTLLPKRRRAAGAALTPDARSARGSGLLFFLIGCYGGAFQAGVGIPLLAALSRAGFDLVRANAIKVLATTLLTAISLPFFYAADQIRWAPALVLGTGFSFGAAIGARIAVRGGEGPLRVMLGLAVTALALKLLLGD